MWDSKLGDLGASLRAQASMIAFGVFGAVSKYFQFYASRHMDELYFPVLLNLEAAHET